MSQHSDELIERCAIVMLGVLTDAMNDAGRWEDCGTEEQEVFKRGIRAVLDEAAKPAPGGPAMREVRIAVVLGDNGTHAATAVPDDGKPDWGFMMDCLEGPDGEYPVNVTHSIVRTLLPEPEVFLAAGVPKPTVPSVPPRVDGEGE